MKLRTLRAVVSVAAAAAVVTGLTLASLPASAQSTTLSARNLPADGKILQVMGQDSDTLSTYKTQVLNNSSLGAPQPGGVTLYTNLVEGGSPAPLAGMFSPANWGSGTVDFASTLNQYPNAALAVGLYLSDSSSGCTNQPLRAIIGRTDADITPALTAQYRGDIDRMVNQFKAWNRPTYLRIGYEFDGPWNCYNTAFYISAFQYIKGRIDALGAANVATVWQSAAWPLNTSTDHPEYNYIVTDPNHLNAWYPGDQYVDYVALSDFYNAGSLGTQWGCSRYDANPTTLQNNVLGFARSHSKPVMIAEASPQGYSTGALTKSCIMNKNPQATSAQTIWNEWYSGYWNWIEQNSDVIRVASYINTNWDSQTEWQCTTGAQAGSAGCSNGYWGDSAVQDNPTVLANFLTEIKKCIFVNGTTGSCSGNPSPPPSSSPPTTPPTTPPSTPSTTPSTGGTSGGGNGFTEGASASQIWFKYSGTLSSAYVHYTISGSGQLNYAMSFNSSDGRWERAISLSPGQTVSYYFDYTPVGQTYQDETGTYTYTA